MADASKYRVLHELGAGGMGLVWKGQLVGQSGFQRPIVIKQLRYARDPDHLQLFVEEARRYALLDHENIGRIFDFERVAGELCIVLEHIDGWTLVDYLERHQRLGLSPDVELSIFIVSRVCRALQYVFERAAIVHRDISPSNIMMTREGTVKLIDFGIATRSGTRDHALTGKPAYMAPEMIVELRADNRSDLFSLGTVLFELLTGERLFTGETTTQVLQRVVAAELPSVRDRNAAVGEGVTAILRRALERDPAARFASAGEMGEACEHHLYDKGYGPTNLTLKRYMARLFPEAASTTASEDHFPIVDLTLLPLRDAKTARQVVGPAGPPAEGLPALAYTRVVAQQPPATLPLPPPDPAGQARTVSVAPAVRPEARRGTAKQAKPRTRAPRRTPPRAKAAARRRR